MSLNGQSSGFGLGRVKVQTTTNRGLPVEFYVDEITRHILYISDTAPPGIREQARAYRENVKGVLDAGIRQAIQSNHTTLIYQLRQAGMHEAAALVLASKE